MSDPAIKRIGREGDILFIGPAQPMDMIRRQIDLYHETLTENDHAIPQEMVIAREFFCAGSRDEALEKARPGFERKYKEYRAHGLQGTDPELIRKVTGDLETLMEDTFIVGSPQDCLEQIAEYRALGFTEVALRLFYPETPQKNVLEHIEIVGKELLPELHQL